MRSKCMRHAALKALSVHTIPIPTIHFNREGDKINNNGTGPMLFESRRSSLAIRLWILCLAAVVSNSLIVLGAKDSVQVQVPPAEDPTPPTIIIPEELLRSFGEYPNILQLSDKDRETFHPVIRFPKNKYGTTTDVQPLDYRNAKGLATPEVIQSAKRKRWRTWFTRPLQRMLGRILLFKRTKTAAAAANIMEGWAIGRYDENREAMYSSELFQNVENQIDGFGGQRTVHLGIDLGGPVGTKVHAFCDGVVHSVGYNSDHGDYGYVIVIKHQLPSGIDVWALYGHLDKSTLRRKQPGTLIRKGQVIGRLGDCHENGGWEAPHVHFQLATRAPETHDMPGASSVEDRPKALLNYPDPRYVLGPLY